MELSYVESKIISQYSMEFMDFHTLSKIAGKLVGF